MEISKRNFIRKLWHYLPFGYFVLAILCLCFVCGIAVGKWQVFPYRFLDAGWDSLNKFLNKPELPHFIRAARYEGEGVTVYEPEQVYQGVTLLTGHWNDGDDEDNWNVGINLIDLEGNVIHEWRCDPQDIWGGTPHNDMPTGTFHDKTTYIHGVLLFPNGDVIISLSYFGLIRLNSQSEILWKLPYRTHHSIFLDENGKLWICGAKWHKDNSAEFPGMKPPFLEDTILKVSPDGVIEREISVLKTIYKSGYDGLLRLYTGDITHINDIEILSKRKEDAFELFQAGDIMISTHGIHTVFVIDGHTEEIKWFLTSPFIGQHDPDFTEDGRITVFDNHKTDFTPKPQQGSRIVSIEPSTKKVTTLYGWKENQYFYTSWCGKHQHLPNGNMLISEAVPGRVFEINRDGQIVWSWIVSRWNEKYVPEIQEGIRYGTEYADFVNGLRKDDK